MDGTLVLVGVETRHPFDCHVAVSDVAPGSGSRVLVLRNEGGDGLWVIVEGMGCGLLLWALVAWIWVSKRTMTLVVIIWVCLWHGR